MSKALALAEQGLETAHPNPRVGCVIAKDGRIIAEGWHERAGEAHAEIAALRAATEAVAGATAYVTLEPCSHHGRTPPCVNALIEARLARVVFAVQDPNPQVSGQGAEMLRQAGITVESGLMEAEATDLNVGFMKRMNQGLPWVRVKLAMSLDGRTALASGASQWITGEDAREDVQRWRARSSAVLTGVGTLLADDPRLNVRTPGFKGRQPLRVVLDTTLRSPPAARMFAGLSHPEGQSDAASVGEVLVLTALQDSGGEINSRQAEAAEVLSAQGVRVEIIPAAGDHIDLVAVLQRLAELEVNEVLVEAGPTLVGQLVSTSLADELLLYIAPKLLGPQGRPLVNLPELHSLEDALGFSLFEATRFGDDLRLRFLSRGRSS